MRRRPGAGAVLIGVLLLIGCARPRIVVLHDPLTAEEHNDLGVAYLGQGQLDLAEREFQLALRKDGDLAAAHYNLGLTFHQRGDWRRAERAYRRALTLDPQSAAARNNLANTLLARGDRRRFAQATQLAREAVDLDPANAFRYYDTLGAIAEAAGELADAEGWYRAALDADPPPPPAERDAIEARLDTVRRRRTSDDGR